MPTGLLFLFVVAWVVVRAAEPVVPLADMPRLAATEPSKAVATLKVRPGFRMDLMAAEPMVTSPVAIAFDESGALYVVEMRDYSERRPEKLGRIRRLVDTDGDGSFDRSTVFLDGIPWPTAVLCWRGGVFIGATPDLLYAKDTDGDGVAEVRETVFTGFASDFAPYATNRLNVQALMNSLRWGVDNRIHGAGSMSGGTVRRVDSPFVRAWSGGAVEETVKPVTLAGRDFSFDPRRLDLRAETGGGQHGMSFDDTGGKFVCSNSDHLQWVAYDAESVPSHPFHSLPSPRLSIAADGPSAEVFRRSPDEPWRVLRTRWRVAGLVEGMIEGGGRPSGYFTGATGVTVHRGDAAGSAFGDVFIADCGSNLIHRKHLRREGFVLKGERVGDEERSEFVASTDNWFRPVQFANAPDGCLWVIDMYRETIEHPWSIPPGLKRLVDLESGRDRGRLWRLVPTNFVPRRGPLPFTGVSQEKLVGLLDHPNGWHRDTAARLLIERGNADAVGALAILLNGSARPASRIQILHTLQALGGLTPTLLRGRFTDASTSVREHSVRLARLQFAKEDGIATDLAAMGSRESDARVQWELGLAAAGLPEILRAELTGHLLQQDSEWIRSAALHSARGLEAGLVTKLASAAPSVARTAALVEVATLLGRSGSQAVLRDVFQQVRSLEPETFRFQMASALSAGAVGAAALRDLPAWQELTSVAMERARSTSSRLPEAIRLLSEVGPRALGVLLLQLREGSVEENRAAVLTTLGRLSGTLWGAAVLEDWKKIQPAAKLGILALLVRRPETALLLLDALESGRVAQTELDSSGVSALRSSGNSVVSGRAKLLFGEPAAVRGELIETFLPALNLVGNAGRGLRLFGERCATCHRLGGIGAVLGPDLASVRSNGKEKLLVSILDPNREVLPTFMAWGIETLDGTTWNGIGVREDASAVVIRIAGGQEIAVSRGEIRKVTRSDRSLMPEGLETGLKPQDLADLLEHLVTAR